MKLIQQDTAAIFNNSSLLLGESVFTSILLLDGQLLFIESHLDRLWNGVQFLFDDCGTRVNFEEIILNELSKIKKESKTSASIRITVVREGIFIHVRDFQAPNEGVRLGLSYSIKSQSIRPSYLKLSNYALERRELSKTLDFDDLLYLTADQKLTETTTSNLFLVVSNQIVKTPPLSSLILDGVMRKNLILFFKKNKIEVLEEEISLDEIKNSVGILLTNSIKGIRYVTNFNDFYFNDKKLYTNIINSFGKFGEKFYE
jgi:branched-subunit amino acid aminotransferase/4-amino-4-deoxychorismate lyase